MQYQLNSQRTDIRLGVIAALTNNASAPWPTFAEDRVYDSKQDVLFHAQGQAELPAVTVYTDTTRRRPIQDGTPPFMSTLDVIIEMTIGGVGGKVETDAEIEEKLDIFEDQILEALFSGTSENAIKLRKMYKKVLQADSMRLANSESHSRLAMRDLVVTVEYNHRCATLSQQFPEFKKLYMCMGDAVTGEEIVQSRDELC
jgi:hypothetical protein